MEMIFGLSLQESGVYLENVPRFPGEPGSLSLCHAPESTDDGDGLRGLGLGRAVPCRPIGRADHPSPTPPWA